MLSWFRLKTQTSKVRATTTTKASTTIPTIILCMHVFFDSDAFVTTHIRRVVAYRKALTNNVDLTTATQSSVVLQLRVRGDRNFRSTRLGKHLLDYPQNNHVGSFFLHSVLGYAEQDLCFVICCLPVQPQWRSRSVATLRARQFPHEATAEISCLVPQCWMWCMQAMYRYPTHRGMMTSLVR